MAAPGRGGGVGSPSTAKSEKVFNIFELGNSSSIFGTPCHVAKNSNLVQRMSNHRNILLNSTIIGVIDCQINNNYDFSFVLISNVKLIS